MKKRILILMVMLSLSSVWAKDLVIDDFTNLKSWKKLGGTAKILPFRPGITHVPFLTLGNSAVAREVDLKPPFKLKIKALHSDYRRGLFITFFDVSLTKGFGVIWDSSIKSILDGQGFVCPISLDLKKKVNGMPAYKTLKPRVASGHSATKLPFAAFELDFTIDGKMSVSVDGKHKFTVQVPKDLKMKYLVLRGTTWGFFDDLEISQ